MKPEFPHAGADFKKLNPHLFGEATPFTIHQEPVVATTKYEAKLEKELQEQITGFLERNGTVVIRSRTDRATSNNVGTPDLLFAIMGHAVAFEVKLPGKKATPDQDNMMARMSANGWICEVVDSYDYAVKKITEIAAKFCC